MSISPVCTTCRLPGGLTVCISEMAGFGTACAQLGVKFGSAHVQYRQNGTQFTLPAGTAHFLEHKLFEKEDGDADYKFAALGAASNAYTDFDRTVYHFRTAEHFPEALRLLLDFIQTPFFTAESVDAERSIIAQELAEAADDPEDRLFYLLLSGLYHTHPVRLDAAGTEESIRQITPEILYRCFEAFYRPQNMVLCCAGNVHTEEILAAAQSMRNIPQTDAEICSPDEPETVAQPYITKKMPVGKPQFAIGFKCRPVTGDDAERTALLGTLVLEMIAGSAAPLTERLLSEGLLSDALTVDCCTGNDWFTLFAEGESDEPQAVCEALLAELEQVKRQGLDAKRFETLRRCAFGDLLIGRNSPPAAADAMMQAAICGISAADYRLRLLPQLTVSDAEETLRTVLRSDRTTLAVIEPA